MERDDVVDLLKAQDWKIIIHHLTHYAIWRSKSYLWNSGTKNELSEGKTPEDIAYTAIEKVWSGTRDWNPKKYPNLLTHLMWIVKSDTEHLFSSQEHQLNVRLLQDKDDLDTEANRKETITESSLSMKVSVETKTAEEELIIRENERYEEKLKTRLYEMVKGDEDLELLLLFFEDGIDKPETIATEMGWEITKVNDLKRKLFRKASKLLNSPSIREKGERT
jgi:hypothetical protein